MKTTTKTVTRLLRTTLTVDEMVKMSQDIGRASQEHAQARERAKEVTAHAKAEVERHRNEVERIGNILANGYEYRDVKVEVTIDFLNKTVTSTRTDTGEIIEVRPAQGDELQGSLNL